MDSLPATPLNAVAPATGHSARGSAGSKDADASAFGEVLDSELAAIAPRRKTADITQLATDDVPADAEKAKAAAADDTQVLQAILDATALVPPAGAAVTAVAPQTVQAGKDTGTAPAHIAGAATAQIAGAAAASITGARDVRASSTIPADSVADEPAAVQSKDETAQKPATPAELATAAAQQDATPAKLAAAAAVTPPVVAAASSANRIMPTDGPALKKDASTLNVAATAPASTTAQAHESREAAAATLGTSSARADEVVTPRSAPTVERVRSDSMSAPSVEKLASRDAAPNAHTVASSLDAFSSAALVSQWTAGPQSDSVNAAQAPASARVDTPIGTSGWGEAFSQRVVWLVDRQQQSAELHVNPPHLGPVEVMLNLKDDGAHIAFCSPHAAVRDAIEASLSDLRNALSQQGLSLGQALVSADPGTAREQLQGENPRHPQRPSMPVSDSGVVRETPTIAPIRRGLVDIFA
jgi:flagellar hook-length control protein FliK